jgi:hypothetical protein
MIKKYDKKVCLDMLSRRNFTVNHFILLRLIII